MRVSLAHAFLKFAVLAFHVLNSSWSCSVALKAVGSASLKVESVSESVLYVFRVCVFALESAHFVLDCSAIHKQCESRCCFLFLVTFLSPSSCFPLF